MRNTYKEKICNFHKLIHENRLIAQCHLKKMTLSVPSFYNAKYKIRM